MILLLLALAVSGASSHYFESIGENGEVRTTCDCGNSKKTRVVGGRETGANEYPLMAALEVPWKSSKERQYCGATIITPWHVVTAAHCALRSPEEINIRVGAHNITNSGTTYGVAKVIRHEKFNKEKAIFDIALLVTKSKIMFDQKVGPACLPNTRLHLEGEKVTALGWGDTSDGGSASYVLEEVELQVISMKDCVKAWDDENMHPSGNTFCTFKPKKDTCTGDSGGPLIWLDPDTSKYTLAGAVSFGGRCGGNLPAVNTDVSAYISWINEKIAASKPGVNACTKVQ